MVSLIDSPFSSSLLVFPFNRPPALFPGSSIFHARTPLPPLIICHLIILWFSTTPFCTRFYGPLFATLISDSAASSLMLRMIDLSYSWTKIWSRCLLPTSYRVQGKKEKGIACFQCWFGAKWTVRKWVGCLDAGHVWRKARVSRSKNRRSVFSRFCSSPHPRPIFCTRCARTRHKSLINHREKMAW